MESQKGVDESLQLSIYALACRDALGLGTPERVPTSSWNFERHQKDKHSPRDDVRAATASSSALAVLSLGGTIGGH